MIVDKEEFKRLKSDGGGILKSVSTIAKFEYGIKEIKKGSSLNLYILTNGIAADISLGKKVFIDFDSVKEVYVSYSNLIISVCENQIENDIVFNIKNLKNLKEVFMTIRDYCNLEYKDDSYFKSVIEKEELKSKKQLEKEEKRIEFERIMNSNPTVSQKGVYVPKEPKKPKEVCCPKCGSTQLTAQKKGIGLGKAAVGAFTFGAYGLVAGGIGKNKIIVTCLACGKQFKPGK